MFCCFGSPRASASSRPTPKHQRNTKHNISRVDALILPSSGIRAPVDHDRQTIELDITPHTIPSTPRQTRARLVTDTDGVSMDVIPPTPDPGARPGGRALPRPPSPTDPVMGRMALPRSRGSPSDAAERGTLSDMTCTLSSVPFSHIY